MSDTNVLNFSSKKEEETTALSSMDAFLSSNQKVLISIVVVAVVAVIAAIAGITFADSAKEKQLSAIDKISYTLTQKSASLSDEELEKRRNVALDGLSAYTSKKGIAGIRSNMLAGDIYYQSAKFEDAKNAYLKAASASPKAYTAPICYYNVAQCFENLNDNENAVVYYEKAESYSDFAMLTHTIFNIGRVKESIKDYQGAKEAYTKLAEKYPDDSWTKIAKSRLLDFEIKGIAQ